MTTEQQKEINELTDYILRLEEFNSQLTIEEYWANNELSDRRRKEHRIKCYRTCIDVPSSLRKLANGHNPTEEQLNSTYGLLEVKRHVKSFVDSEITRAKEKIKELVGI